MNRQDQKGVEQPSIPTPHDRGWISIKQLAALLQRDYRTVRKWVDESRVLAIKVGGQYRITEEEVRHILEHGTREPAKWR